MEYHAAGFQFIDYHHLITYRSILCYNIYAGCMSEISIVIHIYVYIL